MEYIDGTKIESKANKYTFVWRKTVEKNRAKLLEKIRVLLSQVDDVIAQDKAEEEAVSFTPETLTEIATELRDALAEQPASKSKEGKKALRKKQKQVRHLEEMADKLSEYNRRAIEPEAVFGQMKYNMQYKRFRHFGKDKVTMDFAFFAIAFDIKKMAAKRREMPNKQHRKDILEPIYRIDAAKCRRISITGRLFTKKAA
ncbi:MAG: transposase [Paludibacteraceae bacterium]|nr:transposase [Paludibacteraceae bacterium]